ncbi:GntR family transcriptional regulator [Aeoliella mucimassa]|uniref:Bacterial regulatory protein, gntR family n=1 Tax=Aeoliella mucimassa TaxID=2527972 RepID=A0A518AMS5_9BACT|nr:GntR family transcriptional regulator [Aeoliella mucimassa]QDU56028.1 Bacterial regulatory protein, gntR family [Aeoliella mucimassa]
MAKRAVSITPQIADLAELLIEDIKSRQLQPGDRYFSTAEASEFLTVSTSAANRALQLLARRQIISRQQRRGAFILTTPDTTEHLLLHRVHFLVHPLYLRTEGVGNDHILLGMQSELPGVHVQISFLPQGDEVGLVQQLISQALGADTTDGFVLVRASCETQRLVSGSGLPAVVHGSVYPGIRGLARLDRDMWDTGKILTNWLLEQGHKRFAYFVRQIIYPGDHSTLDAISAELAGEGFTTDRLTMRGLPSDIHASIAEIKTVLDTPDPPTAIICRTRRMAEAVDEAIKQLGLERGKFDITFCDYFARDKEEERYAFAKPVASDEEIGHHLAKLLLAQTQNSIEEPECVEVPVVLQVPGRLGS